MLKKLYGDIGLLIRTKIEEITSWPKLRANDSKGLVEFASTVSALVTQLQSAPEGQAELKANSTACILYSRLSPTHQTAFLRIMQKKDVTNFSLEDINKWLQETSEISRKRMQLEYNRPTESQISNRAKRGKGAVAFYSKTSTSSSQTSTTLPSKSEESNAPKPRQHDRKFIRKCSHCDGEHWLSRCFNFKKLSIPDRLKWIKEGRRCWKCARKHKEGLECDLRKPCKV